MLDIFENAQPPPFRRCVVLQLRISDSLPVIHVIHEPFKPSKTLIVLYMSVFNDRIRRPSSCYSHVLGWIFRCHLYYIGHSSDVRSPAPVHCCYSVLHITDPPSRPLAVVPKPWARSKPLAFSLWCQSCFPRLWIGPAVKSNLSPRSVRSGQRSFGVFSTLPLLAVPADLQYEWGASCTRTAHMRLVTAIFTAFAKLVKVCSFLALVAWLQITTTFVVFICCNWVFAGIVYV